MKYDDFIVGETFKTKSLHITEEEIIQFATTFDPQYMHIDKEKQNKVDLKVSLHLACIHFQYHLNYG